MDLKLEGKRVLVTGSTGGIGEGIAKHFAREGATVIINGRREKEAERVVGEINGANGKAIVAVGDLSKDEDVNKVVEISELIEVELPQFEADLEKAGAPWTPGR